MSEKRTIGRQPTRKRRNQQSSSDENIVESTTQNIENPIQIKKEVKDKGKSGEDKTVSIQDSPKEIDSTTNDEKQTENIVDLQIPERMLPPYNVPEKIVIVYDSAKDEVSTGFDLNGENFTPGDMVKRSLKFFLHNKSNIDERHEFALVVLNENNIVWLKDFTNDIKSILLTLDDIKSCEAEDIIALDKLFDLIRQKVEIKSVKSNFNLPPNYIVRTLFIYGRSFTMPQINRKEDIKDIVDSAYFTFDVLMTHETPSSNNNCQKIFNFLQSIDTKGFAYFFPVARNACDLHVSMAKLLSHPLQRPCQKVAKYAINAVVGKVF